MNKILTIIGVLLVAAAGAYVIVGRQDGPDVSATPSPEGSPSPSASVSAGSVLMDGVYLLDVASSSMQWQGKKTLVKDYVDSGTVSLASGTVSVKDAVIASGSLVVNMTSIAAGSTGKGSGTDQLSKHLKSADFFDVTNHPTATFTLTSLVPQLDDYLIVGTLTVKGVTKPISFPASLDIAEGVLTLTGTAKVDRTQYDVRFGSGKFFSDLGDNLIDDFFTVTFRAVARLQTPVPTPTPVVTPPITPDTTPVPTQ